MNKKYRSIYIALGANLSNPKATFPKALRRLEGKGVRILKCSALWQSPAWPPESSQPDYVNACVEVSYDEDARALLQALHAIEADMGRIRSERNAPRPLDLDLLDFRGEVLDAQDIQLPHPRMLSRGFVLFPLSEIAPEWCDPVTQTSISDHIARLPLADVAPMSRLGPMA